MELKMERYFRELKRGSTKTIILSLLERKEMYGYEISKEVRKISGDYFRVPEGALYTALHSLEREGYIEGRWEERDGRQRKYYFITKRGRNLLKKAKKEWELFIDRLSPFIKPEEIPVKKFSLEKIILRR
jgi:DNA-binding PadR family transcriptional regulator